MLMISDWPDYTSSSGDSDTSEVERIVAGQEVASPHRDHANQDHANPEAHTAEAQDTDVAMDTSHPAQWNIPEEDHTAQRIMSLLTEIGTSNLVERTLQEDRHFLHCIHCTGRILHV